MNTCSRALAATAFVQAALFAAPALAEEPANVAMLVVPPETSIGQLGDDLLDNGIIQGELDAQSLERGAVVGLLNPWLLEDGILPELNWWLIESGVIMGEHNPLLEGGALHGALDPSFARGLSVSEYPEGTAISVAPKYIGRLLETTTPEGAVVLGEFDANLLAGGVLRGAFDPALSSGVIMGEYQPEGTHGYGIVGEFLPQLEWGVGVSPPGFCDENPDWGVGVSPPGIHVIALSSEQVSGQIVGDFDPDTNLVTGLRLEVAVPRRFLDAAFCP